MADQPITKTTTLPEELCERARLHRPVQGAEVNFANGCLALLTFDVQCAGELLERTDVIGRTLIAELCIDGLHRLFAAEKTSLEIITESATLLEAQKHDDKIGAPPESHSVFAAVEESFAVALNCVELARATPANEPFDIGPAASFVASCFESDHALQQVASWNAPVSMEDYLKMMLHRAGGGAAILQGEAAHGFLHTLMEGVDE